MERQVLADCPSELLKALVEEHNKVVALLRELAPGLIDQERFPSTITLRRN